MQDLLLEVLLLIAAAVVVVDLSSAVETWSSCSRLIIGRGEAVNTEPASLLVHLLLMSVKVLWLSSPCLLLMMMLLKLISSNCISKSQSSLQT